MKFHKCKHFTSRQLARHQRCRRIVPKIFGSCTSIETFNIVSDVFLTKWHFLTNIVLMLQTCFAVFQTNLEFTLNKKDPWQFLNLYLYICFEEHYYDNLQNKLCLLSKKLTISGFQLLKNIVLVIHFKVFMSMNVYIQGAIFWHSDHLDSNQQICDSFKTNVLHKVWSLQNERCTSSTIHTQSCNSKKFIFRKI